LNSSSACTLTPLPSWCPQNAVPTGFLAGGGLPQTYIPPTGQADARGLTSSYIDPTVMPKIFTWSLGVQHELYKNATIEVRYLGTRGLELPIQARRNDITYFDAGGTPLPTYLDPSSIPSTYTAGTPTDTNFYTFIFNDLAAGAGNFGAGNTIPGFTSNTPNTYQQYGFFGFVTGDPPNGSSIYHAGSVTFTQRARSLSINANYTYSHAIDDSTNEFHTSELNPRRAQDSNNIGADRSNSDLDVPNKFSLAISYQLPKVKSENRFAKALLNGFQLGTIFYAQSGQPITLQSGVDTNGNLDAAGDRIVFNRNGVGSTGSDVFPVCESTVGSTSGVPVGSTYIGSSPFSSSALQGCAINHQGAFESLGLGYDPAIGYTPVDPKAKYVVAGSGAVTTVGRNSFRTPGLTNFNLSLSKSVHFGETKYLQLRADAFNVLNHPSFALSNGSVFNAAGIAAALANGGYAQPANAAFLNSRAFGGGIRQMTLGLKFIF
jgi:hypothetical protein